MRVICDDHGPPNSDDYVSELEPEGYPHSAVVLCGYSDCKNPGKMYLTEEEHKEHVHSGQTTFPAHNNCFVAGKSTQASLLQGKSLPQNQTGIDDFTP